MKDNYLPHDSNYLDKHELNYNGPKFHAAPRVSQQMTQAIETSSGDTNLDESFEEILQSKTFKAGIATGIGAVMVEAYGLFADKPEFIATGFGLGVLGVTAIFIKTDTVLRKTIQGQ